jgi:putative MATE family efflux protein
MSIDPTIPSLAAPAAESTPASPPASLSLLATLAEAVRGSTQDFTEGPIGRALILLAVPMVLEMSMESLFAIVDIFWVSKLGADAVATVGITESLLSIVYAVAMGLAMGATALVARRIGEKDPDAAARAGVQAIALGAALAAVLGVAGGLLGPRLLGLMGGSPAVVASGGRYVAVMLGGNVVIMLLFVINAVFRGGGDAAVAMRTLFLANGLNLVLDPVLIFGLGPAPRLGVTGAAVATTIGRGVGVAYLLWTLARGRGRVAVRRAHLRVEAAAIARLLRVSAPGMFQVAVGTASWLGLVRIVSRFGSAALAGYTIGMRAIVFAILPSWGMANAAATMVGQNLGARRPERAESAVWRAGLYNVIFLGVVGTAFALLAGPIVRLFTIDAAIVPYGVDALRIVSFGFLFYAYGMVMQQAFNGAGDTWTPTFMNLACFWAWEIPLAWTLAGPFRLGPRGVFIAITVGFSTLAIAAVILFRRGTWKQKRV